MQKILTLFFALCCFATFAGAQPGSGATEPCWVEIIGKKDVAAARELAAKPGFDPLMRMSEIDTSLLAYALEMESGQVASVLIVHAKPETYLRNPNVIHPLYMIGNESALKLVLANPKFDPNQLVRGAPLLWLAVSVGNLEAVKALLANPRIRPMTRDENGETPLFTLIDSRSGALAALLLADKRIDPNAVDKNGNSALHINAHYGDAGVLQKLVNDPRTHPNLKNKKGQTPLFVAASSDLDLVRVLVANPRVKVGAKEKSQIAKLKRAGESSGKTR